MTDGYPYNLKAHSPRNDHRRSEQPDIRNTHATEVNIAHDELREQLRTETKRLAKELSDNYNNGLGGFDFDSHEERIMQLIQARDEQAYDRGIVDTLEHVKLWADKTEVTYNVMMRERLTVVKNKGKTE